MDAIDVGPCAKTKMAAIELFNMYAIDTPCEHDIFRTVLPIDFKSDFWCHSTYRTDAIDFGPCAKTKMAAIVLFNMYDIDTPCERNIFRNQLFHQTTSNLKIVVISSRGRTLLILGHVRKWRWPPSNFLICML